MYTVQIAAWNASLPSKCGDMKRFMYKHPLSKIEIYSMQCERIWSRLQTCVTNVRRRKYECDAFSCSVCKHGQCIVGVHMCDGTNRKERRWEIWFWQWAVYPFIIQLALCASFGGQEQPTVEAKLLPGITAMMVILKSFHKSLFFLDHSLAAVQLFRKCIVPFPVRQKPGLRLVVGKVVGWDWFSQAVVGNSSFLLGHVYVSSIKYLREKTWCDVNLCHVHGIIQLYLSFMMKTCGQIIRRHVV